MLYKSTKLFSGYSACFRQWKADSHCKYLHGYSLEFKATFQGRLDHRNWVVDFGCFKQNGIKKRLSEMFDHTTIVAKDDPNIEYFQRLDEDGIIQLRVIDDVGCEKFAEYVFNILKELDTLRARVISVECIENKSNSAIFGND